MSAISLSLDVLLNIVYPILLILGLGATRMVSKLITELMDVQDIQRALRNRMELDAKKDERIRKLEQDLEAEVRLRQGMQADIDREINAPLHQLLDAREQLRWTLERITELESEARDWRAIRNERFERLDRKL